MEHFQNERKLQFFTTNNQNITWVPIDSCRNFECQKCGLRATLRSEELFACNNCWAEFTRTKDASNFMKAYYEMLRFK